VFDTVTTGAANDIEKATDIARNMVTRYGMSKKFGLVGLATVESQYLEGRTELNCSDETAAQIDAEVVEILRVSYEKALSLLRENRDVMDKLAEFLIEKETITGKEFMEIYRREKGIPEPEDKKPEDSRQEGNKQTDSVAAGANPVREPAIEMPGPIAVPEPIRTPSAEPMAQQPSSVVQSPAADTKDSEGQTQGTESVAGQSQPATAEESDEKPGSAAPTGRFSNGRID